MIAAKEEIAARLTEALVKMGFEDERGRPQRIADEFRVSRETARKWLAGEVIPETWRIAEIGERSGMSVDYILTGRGPANFVAEPPPNYGGDNIAPGPELMSKLPLISWVQAGAWNNVEDPYQPGVAEKWIWVPRRYSKRAYCLRVRGDSMQAPEGPSFPDGSVICVEPDLPPEHRKFVITRLDDTQEATFKQLIIDGNQQLLRPLNPRYPIMPIDKNATHCGVVRQMVMDFD